MPNKLEPSEIYLILWITYKYLTVFYLCFHSFYYKDKLYKVLLFKKKKEEMKQQKKKLAYYLTSEKPTSKVRHLAFKIRSLVISSFYYF